MRKPNGYGSIHMISKKGVKRRNPYRVRITAGFNDEGKQLFKTLGYFPNRKEAEIALASYNANPYDLASTEATISIIYEKWSEGYYKNASKKQIDKYKLAFDRLEKYHKTKIVDVRVAHIHDSMSPYSDVNRKTIRALYSKLLEFAIKQDLNVAKNYAKFVKIDDVPPVESSRTIEHNLFTKDEIKDLWKREGELLVDILLMLLYSGMRISELLDVELDNIYLEDGYLIGGNKTHAGRNRVIPIHKDVKHLWERHTSGDKKHLFVGARGGKLPYSTIGDALRDSDINHVFHDTRYSFISKLRDIEVSEIKLQRIVGHSNKSITDRYTKFEIDSLIKEVAKLKYL